MAVRTTDSGGNGRRRSGRLGPVLGIGGLLLVVLGLASACSASSGGLLPGGSMRLAWDVPFDDSAREYGNGDWLVGDTVVRSRYDAVTAFDAGSGKQRWEYVPPGREAVCAVSRRADRSVVLIARGAVGPGGGCATVAALDLTNGRELWHTRRTPADRTDSLTDLVATGGGLAVLRDGYDDWAYRTYEKRRVLPGSEALRAFDLRTGAPRWKAAVPHGCVPERVAAAERQVVAVLACDRTELKLAAFAPADGKERWTVPLGGRPTPGTDADVTLLSADPLVVQVGGTVHGSAGAYLAFGEDGRALGRIEATGDHGTIPTHKPAQVAVADGRLHAVAEGKDGRQYRDRVVTFDLATGHEVWREMVPATSKLLALDATGGRVTALADRGSRNDGLEELFVLDAATGDEQDRRTFDADVDKKQGELADLLTHRGLVIAVRSGAQPFSAYERG
ncbi:PQQ-binding-like beta-propeller repeat protein [Streptomyces sp. NBC_01077]|uniref:outer membrane protein assembly factor BamB family protein n=1 Tax=Streptomyces sp. NBC_01077 TaxID=2903746 RepID=UPI00386AA333|nr:PQQ-binding-like beta-propeller repeat protein [Streptomyces sp. NBC_01077]